MCYIFQNVHRCAIYIISVIITKHCSILPYSAKFWRGEILADLSATTKVLCYSYVPLEIKCSEGSKLRFTGFLVLIYACPVYLSSF